VFSRIQQEGAHHNRLLQEVLHIHLKQEVNPYYQMDVDYLQHPQDEALLKHVAGLPHLLGLLQSFQVLVLLVEVLLWAEDNLVYQ
jgi:hypothetical protein